jgi:O-antigen/teichoic acid export membrane protein
VGTTATKWFRMLDQKLGRIGRVIAAGASAAVIIKFSGVGSKYVAEILYARWLGEEGYGVYAFSVSVAQFLSVFASFGLINTVLRFVPEYASTEKPALLKGIVRRSQTIVLAVGAVVIAVVVAGVVVEGTLLQKYGPGLFLGIVAGPCIALVETQAAIIRARKKIAWSLFPRYLGWPVGALAVTLLLFELTNLPGPASALLATLLVLVVISVGQWGGIQRLFRNVKSVRPAFKTKHWLAVAGPLLFVAGFKILLDRTDILMVGALRSSAEAGLYSAAVRTGGLVAFVLASLNTIAAPLISQYWSLQEKDKLEETVTFVIRWAFWPSFALVVGILFFGEYALSLFGQSFREASTALTIIAVGQLVNACAGPVGYLITLTGYERISAKIYGTCALLNVPLNFILIRQFGMEGAAVATAVTVIAWNLGLAYATRQRVGIDIFAIWLKVILFK